MEVADKGEAYDRELEGEEDVDEDYNEADGEDMEEDEFPDYGDEDGTKKEEL